MGFDDEDSNESDPDIEAGILTHRKDSTIDDEIIFEEHLLDGLSNWLDRLFEGTTQRYHIQYWPEHMK
jgi:DnaJ family protein C protein 16